MKKNEKEELVEIVKNQKWCPYVNTTLKQVGLYATNEDMLLANKSKKLKKLVKKFGYSVQTVIK
jgi:hypothetical protein